MGVGAYDENIQKIMKDCSMCEYTGQPMALQLSTPRGGMKNRYMVFLNMSIMPTKLDYPAKEKWTKFNIIKFYICHNCLFRLLVFFFFSSISFFFKSQRMFYPLCLSVNSKVTYLTFTSCWEAMAANSPSALTNLTLTPVRSPISVWVTRTCVSVVSVV